jgi:glutamate-5-semialdehyde dehydrogenase
MEGRQPAGVRWLERLEAGQAIIFGGDRVTEVPEALAEAFRAGDRLVVVQDSGALLRVPAADHALVDEAVRAAHDAFLALGTVADEAVSAFYGAFAARLEDDAVFAAMALANAADVSSALARGRSTTRLVLSSAMRADMVAGLRTWQAAPSGRGELVERVDHGAWAVEQRRAALGVVGFVFEGRPNVFADATGVLRGGNTVVFRIGSDALGTAMAIHDHALRPALAEAGLPAGAATLLAAPSRASGYALFSHPLLSLAVARGSGEAVAQLGAVARQAGTPVSLHGTGGAWLVGGVGADAGRFEAAVRHSLDRKVCNTLNVCCIVNERAPDLMPRFLAALEAAGEQRHAPSRLHVVEGSEGLVPAEWFARQVEVRRADGPKPEPGADIVALGELAREWEWEDNPEVTLIVVPTLRDAVSLFNRHSPRLVATLLSEDQSEQEVFWAEIDAPFVGDGFTRWVDGQFAFDRPELGLSSWQHGRLFARGGVLSGDSVFTLRTRASQTDPDLRR